MPANKPVPAPGSLDAIAAGCLCTPPDIEEMDDPIWPGWLTQNCPLHDLRLNLGGDQLPSDHSALDEMRTKQTAPEQKV